MTRGHASRPPHKAGVTAFLAFLCFLVFSTLSHAATPKFPELKGRVVDNAHLLSSNIKRQLDVILSGLEKETTDQLVVVMLPDLQGFTIEDFGYQLGRHWGIGQKGKDNGILLIVAPTERKLRIEVGYGLEGVLTDAQSSVIINSVIVPRFKEGKMGEGVLAGVQAIISVLGGGTATAENVPPPPSGVSPQGQGEPWWLEGLVILCVIILGIRYPSFAWYILLNLLTSSSYRGGGSRGGGGGWSSGGGGGGFSGGGGSFGGGGSSGSW